MSLSLELLSSELDDVWSDPREDSLRAIADTFEEYWGGAQIQLSYVDDPITVNFLSGIAYERLEGLLASTAKETAADIFEDTFITLVSGSYWIQPPIPPYVVSNTEVYAIVNNNSIYQPLVSLFTGNKDYSIAPEFSEIIHEWCLGTTVSYMNELGVIVIAEVF